MSFAPLRSVNPGCLTPLTDVFGADAFDDGLGAPRIHNCLQSGLPCAIAFEAYWSVMQTRVGEPLPGTVLAASASKAGENHGRIRNLLTRAVERAACQHVDVTIRALPHADPRRAAWVNVDRYSTAWVACCPTTDLAVTNAELVEIATRYLGLPSPACQLLHGQRIGNTRQTLDDYGIRLCSLALPGDGWRDQHDVLKWHVHDECPLHH